MRYTTVASLVTLLSTASALPSSLQAREEGKRTVVTLGRNYIDYGCEADVKKLLREAIEDKCVGGAQCDDASPYVAKISWTWDEQESDSVSGRSNWPEERDIFVTVEGEYPSKDAMRGIRDLVVESVNDTWDWKLIETWKPRGHSMTGVGNPGETGECGMVRFPNYIGVALFDGDTLDYTLSITVEVDDSKPDDSFCSDETSAGVELLLTPAGTAGGYAVSGAFCAAFDS